MKKFKGWIKRFVRKIKLIGTLKNVWTLGSFLKSFDIPNRFEVIKPLMEFNVNKV